MGGIETLMSKAGTMYIDGGEEGDPREILTNITGLRVFDVPDDPEVYRVILESSVTPTDEEVAAVKVVSELLERFGQTVTDKTSALLAAKELDVELKADILQAILSNGTIIASFQELMRVVAKTASMDVLIPRATLRGLRILKDQSDEVEDADVSVKLS